MTPTAPVNTDNQATKPVRPPRLPPEEQFWKRYSPHHEFPLSSVTSVALHILAVVLLVVVGWLAWKLGLAEENKPLPVTPIVVEAPAGGGGDPSGVKGGTGSGGGEAAIPGEAAPETPPDQQPAAKVPLANLDPGKVDPIDLPNFVNKDGTRLVNPSNPAIESLSKISKSVRDKMFTGLGGGGGGGQADKGRGGSGTGGGRGSGDGTSDGPGTGRLSQRQQRLLRWTMVFNTNNGQDYAKQLQSLGAIVAYPDPTDPNQYRLMRQVWPPAPAQIEDLRQITRIFWVDSKPESVASLARGLGINPRPPHFVAFFPEKLEDRLAQMEKQHANGAPEDQIISTRFEIVRVGGGYEPRITHQEVR